MRTFIAVSLILAATGSAQDLRVTDATGRSVLVPPPSAIQRVYPAGPPASVLLFTLAPEKMLGWTIGLTDAQKEYLPDQAAKLPKLGRLTGRGSTANVEDLIKAGTSLVIDVGTVSGSSHALAKDTADRTGLPTLLLDGTLEALPGTYRTLGKVLGVPERGEKMAAYIEKSLAAVKAGLAKAAGAKPVRVYYGRGPKGLETATAGSINAEVFERVGADNVAALSGPHGAVAQVSPEDVVSWAPEIIITSEPVAAEHMRTDAVFKTLSAVVGQKLYQAPNLPFGWVDYPPCVNRLLGLHWMARLLHPKAFPDDLREHVAEFHELFYHRKPTPAQLHALLKGLAR